MNLEELIAEAQIRCTDAEGVDTAMWLASKFTPYCQNGQAIPRWALLLRAMSSRINMQQTHIKQLEEIYVKKAIDKSRLL